jgi:hypothetical protein
MRRRGMTPKEIYAALAVVNAERCRPPLEDAHVRKIAESIGRYAPASDQQVGHTGRTAATTTDQADTDDAAPSSGSPPVTLQQLETTFQEWLHLPDLGPLHFLCGTIAANHMSSDPLWVMFVGGPGWGKTELLMSTRGLPHVHTAATITEAALLSGTRRKERDAAAKGGLLRQIGLFGFLVLKDFTSILSMNRDLRSALLAALREIYDGSWTRHVGVDGGRTLEWQGKLAVIAGCTGAIDSFHAVIGAMGERFIFYRFAHDETDEALQAGKALDLYGLELKMRYTLSGMMERFFAGLTIPMQPPSIERPDRARLIALASLAARCRSAVERNGYSREIELIPDAEAPGRLALTLARLLAGLRCIGVTPEDAWTLLVKVALDCMPDLRRKVFLHLVEHSDDRFPSRDIATMLGNPTTTTTHTLEDLAAHRIVSRHPAKSADEWNISDWALNLYKNACKPSHRKG